jgi:hypothetical protein
MISTTYQRIPVETAAFEVRRDPITGFKGLFSNRSFGAGETMETFKVKSLRNYPTYLTVQIDATTHFEFDPEFLQYMNHHCDPNVYLNLEELSIVAQKPIEAGDELTFFYPSTEWKMDRPFQCQCGSDNCFGTISGAHAISAEQLSNYKLSPYIQQKLS